MKKFSSWFSGSQPGKQQRPTPSGRPKKNVHWKSAERPSPPGRPILIPLSDQQPDVVTLKWERPKLDGGSPITGYIIEHRRMGSPHWVRSTPASVVTCEVAISGLEPGWRYQFRAIAENIVGRSDPSELSDPLTVTLQRNAISVPRFVKELADLSVVENERVEFRVTVLGQPPPEISWFKDGYEIFSSRRTKIVNDNDVSVLVIHQVALTDEGEIKCTATNRAGHVVTKARLLVEAPPKIRLPRNYEDGLIVEADEVLRLKVGIAGQPPPTVVWLHEGEPIPNSDRHELVTSDKNSSLKIENVKRVDRGEYTIRATNKLGEDTTSFLVTVTSRPYPPGKVRINTSYGKSATLSWTAPEDDGGCKIGSYIVEYFRIGWNVWLKAATTRQLSTTLNDLIEGSEYKFRVKAENPYGLSDPGEESDVLYVPDPKRAKDQVDANGKPTPPRRKTLSPQRAVDEERGGEKQPSPLPDRKTKPQILDNEDLHREMSYGTNLEETPRRTLSSSNQIDVQGAGGAIKRSPSPRNPVAEKKVASVSTSTSRPALPPLMIPPKPPIPSPSILPIKPVSSPKTPPAIAPALGPVLTSAIAPVLRFAPNTASHSTPPPLPTPTTPSTMSTPSTRPISPRPSGQAQKTSPEPKLSPMPKSSPPKNSVAQQNETCAKKEPEPRAPDEEQTTIALNRSLSPSEVPMPQTPPETPPQLKKTSKALQRSEEPVDIDDAQQQSKFSNNQHRPEQTRQASYNGGAPNPRIHVSAPASEPADFSDVDKRDEVHTSNEFMLVLFHKNSAVKDKEKQDSFDLDLEDALQPPPISISSPDLASLEFSNLHTFPLRRSVSSTELLYERAMARFYEAVELEEAEKARKLKISQEKLPNQAATVRKRLGSMSEAERLSFEKRSLRRRSTDIGDLVSSSNAKWDSKDNLSKVTSRTRNLLDDTFRQESQETDEISDYHGKPGDSFDVESDYTASTDSVSEDSIEKFKRELVARTRSTSDELETYHPRSMSGGVFTPYRAPTPEQSVIVLNRPMPLASPDFVPKPILKRPSKENVLKDGSLSPTNGLGSPNVPGSPTVPSSPTDLSPPVLPNAPIFSSSPPVHESASRRSPPLQRSPPPQLSYHPQSSPPRQRSPQTQRSPPPQHSPPPQSSPPPTPSSPTLPPNASAEKAEKAKGFKSFFRWDKKQPAEKSAEKETPATRAAADAEAKRKTKEEEDRKKREAEKIFEEEAKVVVDHYSDIVRQVGTTRKYNTPLYLNREELKKAAEKAAQEGHFDDDIDDFNPSSEHYERLHKPRLSLVERQQIQHVKDISHLAKLPEKPKLPETPSEEDATPSSASQTTQRSESRGRTKIVKIKKIVKKRVPSGTRSREQSSSRPPSSLGASSDDFGRRPASRARFVPEPSASREAPPPAPPQPPPPSTALVALPQKSPQELTQEAEEKVRSAVSYMTDVCLFIAACYVYLFKDARLVLPILALMVYRQLGEVLRNIIPDWMRRKRQ